MIDHHVMLVGDAIDSNGAEAERVEANKHTSMTIISPALGRESIKLQAYTRIVREVNVILCDLCGNQKECFQKEIDGREFDICADCWRPPEEKLRGKGRSKRKRETVFLPPPITPEPEEPKTPPRLPPKIIGQVARAN